MAGAREQLVSAGAGSHALTHTYSLSLVGARVRASRGEAAAAAAAAANAPMTDRQTGRQADRQAGRLPVRACVCVRAAPMMP